MFLIKNFIIIEKGSDTRTRGGHGDVSRVPLEDTGTFRVSH